MQICQQAVQTTQLRNIAKKEAFTVAMLVKDQKIEGLQSLALKAQEKSKEMLALNQRLEAQMTVVYSLSLSLIYIYYACLSKIISSLRYISPDYSFYHTFYCVAVCIFFS